MGNSFKRYEAVRKMIDEDGRTQRETAEALGVSEAYVSKVYNDPKWKNKGNYESGVENNKKTDKMVQYKDYSNDFMLDKRPADIYKERKDPFVQEQAAPVPEVVNQVKRCSECGNVMMPLSDFVNDPSYEFYKSKGAKFYCPTCEAFDDGK